MVDKLELAKIINNFLKYNFLCFFFEEDNTDSRDIWLCVCVISKAKEKAFEEFSEQEMKAEKKEGASYHDFPTPESPMRRSLKR